MTSPARRNLVVCRAGDASLHREWMGAPGSRSFDLWLDCYGADGGARWAGDPAVISDGRGGTKWPRVARLLEERRAEVEAYDAVWFPDDDLRLDAAAVDRMFALFHAHGLALAQPALGEGSFASHAITLRSRAFVLRFVNFVEVMAPVFSRRALEVCAPTFTESASGYGLDLVWPRLLGDPAEGVAILDEVPVVHTRPVGNGNWLRALDEAPLDELARVAARHGVALPFTTRVHGGILGGGGGRVSATHPMFLALLTAGAPAEPMQDVRFRVALADTLPHDRPRVRTDGRPLGAPRAAPAGKGPAVSVVVPCHRQARFLRMAVSSVALQTFKDWELLVVDDGSPDDTAAVARELIAQLRGRRVRLLRQENQGLAAARNAGIRAARGRYVLPLDADDALEATFLERTVRALEEDPDAEIAGTDGHMFGAREAEYRTNAAATLRRLQAGDCLNYCSLYRREVWEAVGGYNPNMTAGYEDWDFWIGCAERGFKGVQVREPLFLYRVKEESMVTRALRFDRQLRARIVLNHPRAWLPEQVAEAEAVLRRTPLPPHGSAQPAPVAVAV